MMKNMLPLILLVVSGAPALAHVDPMSQASFAAGLAHPVFGPDHVLAMVAVGMWAALAGGRARWAVVSAFVGGMIAGFAMALAAIPLSLVEPMILVSVIVLGLLVAVAAKLPLGVSCTLVAILGVFHGYAHGTEMGTGQVLGFGAGFILATAGLHGCGLLVATALSRFPVQTSRRIMAGLGGATMLGGIGLGFA